ncbi:MAG: CHAT domain-containing protein [Symploca sp. SIO3C6]|nr:CHAT domain-containing protein [Symploca sp. SIO3C6]
MPKQIQTWNHLALVYRDLGKWEAASVAIDRAIAILKNNPSSQLLLAQTLNNKGAIQLAKGQSKIALETWKQSEAAYTAVGDQIGTIGTQLNQTQALQTLGQYRRAKIVLEQINAQLQQFPDSPLKANGLHSLGIALLRVGDFQPAQIALLSSLKISQSLNDEAAISKTLMELGNVARVRQEFEKAQAFYQQAALLAFEPSLQLQVQLNQFSLLVDANEISKAISILPTIKSLLEEIPPSRITVYARVNLAENLIKIKRWEDGERGRGREGEMGRRGDAERGRFNDFQDIAQILIKAVSEARVLQDQRAEAYALGQLGHLYESYKQRQQAKKLTQQALLIAVESNAQDIAISWQWQLGRILAAQGLITEAINAYNQAFETLSQLRGDLVALNPEVGFAFRDKVEPIYRQLVQLLLKNEPSQANLRRAREVIEALQLAQLNNFFREICFDAQPQQIDQVDPKAAVFYSIILPDRLAVILSVPGKPLRYYDTILISDNSDHQENASVLLERTFDDLFATLNPFISNSEPLRPHQQLYDWLIRPVEQQLQNSGVKTLVFVLDGVLRGIPMAALHDRQHYLIEKYNLALTPGLQLLPPQLLKPEQLETLAGGLSEPRQGFSALPGVIEEVEQIAKLVPADVLLNQDFTRSRLEVKIDSTSFPVVHLATHGQFSSQAEKTFLLTWDGRINVKDLDQLLQVRERQNKRPIELLILSACQTAAGDKRAALGLAGVALRSGARSTMAALWSVQDDSTTKLMIELYKALKQPGVTKAEALRQAQLSLLKSPQYQHPAYWSAFVLVGNWL